VFGSFYAKHDSCIPWCRGRRTLRFGCRNLALIQVINPIRGFNSMEVGAFNVTAQVWCSILETKCWYLYLILQHGTRLLGVFWLQYNFILVSNCEDPSTKPRQKDYLYLVRTCEEKCTVQLEYNNQMESMTIKGIFNIYLFFVGVWRSWYNMIAKRVIRNRSRSMRAFFGSRSRSWSRRAFWGCRS
jgi:hypothetical protein